MLYNTHGGSCCGYGHVYNFDHSTEAQLDRCIHEHLNAARGENRILEAILSERQVNPTANESRIPASVRVAGGWPTILARKGFRLAAQWENSNTGRRCYQFLLIPRLLTDDPAYRPSFDWEGVVAAVGQPHPVFVQVQPPAEPRPQRRQTVSVEFYAHLRQGGRRGPFETEAAVRAAYPRVARIDHRQIMSDGSSNWSIVRQ